MDQSKQQNRLQSANTRSKKKLKDRIKRRLIEGCFTLLGYLASKQLRIHTAFGLFFGGLCGMIIAYIILPE